MRYCVFDIETDNLYAEVSKLHCLAYYSFDTENDTIANGVLTDRDAIKNFLETQEKTGVPLVGHNIIRYDIPVLEKLLGVKWNGKIVDTLAISWYLFPERHKHGLEGYGDEFGVPKPVIKDWNNLSIEEYVHRCKTDVEINTILWKAQMDYLSAIYDGDYSRIVGYLNFKFQCLLEQEMVGITIDTQLCERTKHDLEYLIEEKLSILSSLMPKDIGKVLKKRPTVMYKKDGSLSSHGTNWLETLKEMNLPEDTEVIYDTPNPGSTDQLKKWLLMLGWKPITFKENNKGEKVSQVSLPHGQGICPSVKALYEIEPQLEALEGLFMAQHRYGIIKSFLENMDKNGKVYATAHGFTNTLRMKHSVPCVNLPSISKPYGEQIRGCLTVPSNAHIFFGADLSALEDSTKQHYIYFYDPEYVREMRVPGFDPHCDIAVLGDLMTKEESDTYKMLDKKKDKTEDEKKVYIALKDIRGDAKAGNFACTYGAGPPKIADTIKKPLAVGKKIHEAYWKRNWAVKQTAKDTTTKTVYNQRWLYNPISGFWYFLKYEKDIFSTLNQGSGVYVFDSWLRIVKGKVAPIGANIVLQYHDEFLGMCLKFQKGKVESLIAEATKEVNEEIKLNIEIKNSIDWGQNYACVH